MPDVRWLGDEDRHVNYRTEYLVRTTDLNEKRARVLALRELGYSLSGIAKRVEQTEGTVKGYLEGLAVRYGQTGVETRHPDEITTTAPIEPVTPEDIRELPEETRAWWVRLAAKRVDSAPEWFDEDDIDLEAAGGVA